MTDDASGHDDHQEGLSRRDVLRRGSVLALGAALPAGTFASSSLAKTRIPATTAASKPIKLGFIALTDCASVVMADTLGYYKKRRHRRRPRAVLDADLGDDRHRWQGRHDSAEDRDDAQQQRPGDHAREQARRSRLRGPQGRQEGARGRQGQDAGDDVSRRHPRHLAALRAAGDGDRSQHAQDHPDPAAPDGREHDRRQHGRLLRRRAWNAVAVRQNIGFTAITSQDIWTNHPEKALVVGEQFATSRRADLKRVMGAVLQASKWLDVPANRAKAATVLGTPAYVNTRPEDSSSGCSATTRSAAATGRRYSATTRWRSTAAETSTSRAERTRSGSWRSTAASAT